MLKSHGPDSRRYIRVSGTRRGQSQAGDQQCARRRRARDQRPAASRRRGFRHACVLLISVSRSNLDDPNHVRMNARKSLIRCELESSGTTPGAKARRAMRRPPSRSVSHRRSASNPQTKAVRTGTVITQSPFAIGAIDESASICLDLRRRDCVPSAGIRCRQSTPRR